MNIGPSSSTKVPLTLEPRRTRPDGRRLAPRGGRNTIVGASGQRCPYAPEAEELFELPADIAILLAAVQVDAGRAAGGAAIEPGSQAAYEFVTAMISWSGAPPHSENRWRHQYLRDVVVPASQVCHFDCVYRYAVELNKANKVMSVETAKGVIDRTMTLAPDGLASVKFLGGEPTLAWHIIDQLMDGYTKASASADVPTPTFTMVTNGTRMADQMIESTAARHMQVLVSMDGEQDIHDQLGPDRRGRGRYAAATRTLRALAAGGVQVSIESVYTRRHYLDGITPQAMIEHFLSLGVREFQIPPAVGEWHLENTFHEIMNVTSLYAEAVRASVRSFRTDEPYLLRGIQFVLGGFAIRERKRRVCGAGQTFMGINYDGEAFPCYPLRSPDVSHGLVHQDRDMRRYQNIRSWFADNGKENQLVCREGCLGTSWHLTPEVTEPPAYFCAFQKTLTAATLAEIASAREAADWPRFVANRRRHLTPLTGVGHGSGLASAA